MGAPLPLRGLEDGHAAAEHAGPFEERLRGGKSSSRSGHFRTPAPKFSAGISRNLGKKRRTLSAESDHDRLGLLDEDQVELRVDEPPPDDLEDDKGREGEEEEDRKAARMAEEGSLKGRD